MYNMKTFIVVVHARSGKFENMPATPNVRTHRATTAFLPPLPCSLDWTIAEGKALNAAMQRKKIQGNGNIQE